MTTKQFARAIMPPSEYKKSGGIYTMQKFNLAPTYKNIEVHYSNYRGYQVFNTDTSKMIEVFEKDGKHFILIEHEGCLRQINLKNAKAFNFGRYKDKFEQSSSKRYATNEKRMIDLYTFEVNEINHKDMMYFNPVKLQDGEIPKEIEFEGKKYHSYYVTNFGRVLRKRGAFWYEDVSVRKQKSTLNGRDYYYYYVSLPAYDKSKRKQDTYSIHRLVAYHFQREKLEALRKQYPYLELRNFEVDHIEGITSQEDNHIDNLQWCLKQENKHMQKLRNKRIKLIEAGQDTSAIPKIWNGLIVYR